MAAQKRKAEGDAEPLRKKRTGIKGLDEITGGGLPEGRPTLLCGGAGCGKTLLAMEFLVRGALEFGDPGVFMSFEETSDELAKNVANLGFDLKAMAARRKLVIDHVAIEKSEIEETGEYDLDGLFIRLGHAVASVGAKRVVLDTLESLFTGFERDNVLRAELRRLFRWLKERGLTAVITAEGGDGALTRLGLEEYVSDCVIALDHRVQNQVSTRRLRIVKYRGSLHGTNEYPYLIDEGGVSILPVTSVGLRHEASNERVPTGVARLDEMLDGRGYFRGSSVLVGGTAGTGKTSLAAGFVAAACRRRERCLYFAFEESPSQILRNMSSVGLDLGRWVGRGLLRFHATRPSAYGLELHLANMTKAVEEFGPSVVVLDPVTNFFSVGEAREITAALTRVIDHFKTLQVTALFTSLTRGGDNPEQTDVDVSSLMDSWILLREEERGGERRRLINVLKSRGMAHSNQTREFRLTGAGVQILDPRHDPLTTREGGGESDDQDAPSNGHRRPRAARGAKLAGQGSPRRELRAEALRGRPVS